MRRNTCASQGAVPAGAARGHRVGRVPYLYFATAFGPQRFDVDGRDVVVWRGDSGLVAMDAVCCHCGASLDAGHVESVVVTVGRPDRGSERQCLVCPRHRFSFDEEGRIADIPTEIQTVKWPERTVQRDYRIEIEDGEVVLYDDAD